MYKPDAYLCSDTESHPLLDQMIEALPQKERTTRIKEIIPKLQAILGVILRFIV